ncbi:hypothetical protein [Frigidibacter sp. ROC022]|uniref:hypothetical protein n=1 Tax=Frigidibacter sp. ROC022 TaxID=2971796 RepID=UPI00215A2624|nr:hypothetical protein [Frigidibacter sp. ROC022]MCR8723621.1 hypothetical protein [Frigidibacter sp. ROC022]
MALIKPTEVDPDLLKRAAEALEFLKESSDFYRDLSLRAKLEGEDSPARARDRLHEYRKVALSALEDGRRVADEINKSRGIVRDYALDLAAARDEVERLLDRLAAEIREGPVSGQPE